MLAHAVLTELIHLVHNAVEEVAVMRYDDDRAVKRLDGLLQHIFAGHVQVVGGLVEDEQVDGLQQQAYHRQTALLTAAEHLDLLVGILSAEHECAQDVVDARAYVAHGHIVDGVVHGQRLVEQLGLVLGKIANLDIVPDLQFAVIGYLTHNALDKGGFSCAVLAHKGDFLATLDGECHIVEHIQRTVILAQVLGNDGIVTATGCGRELEAHA